jgi:signal transduction histidine kinase
MGAGFYLIHRENRANQTLTIMTALESFAAADSRADHATLLLLGDHSWSFDGAQRSLEESQRTLTHLEATVGDREPLSRHVAVLRRFAEQKEELLLRLLNHSGSIRSGRYAVARVLDEMSLREEDAHVLNAWLAFALVPSEANLTLLRDRLGDVTSTVSEDLRKRGLLLASDQTAAHADIASILEVPIAASVDAMRRDVAFAGRQVAARGRWLAIFAIIVVGGLASAIQHLVARLEKSRNFERGMKDQLEQEVNLRTRELTETNARLADDIARRERAETARDRMEVELRHAQKLEAVGRLAAGIAHEINTPAQYVGDNTRFLKGAFDDIFSAIRKISTIADASDSATRDQGIEELKKELEKADVAFLETEIPQAFDQCLEGLERVSTIVGAMKEFSHPGHEKSLVDLNRAIETTITVARNEWKYVADVVTEFDPELPAVPCVAGELNQVFLNIIVNAAHAIVDAAEANGGAKGTITIGTSRDGDSAVVRIADTGAGMSEAVCARIFEPFFTTKDVGKGTGQGLAIAHSVVHEKHSGTITVESTPGKGTEFRIRLPLELATAETADELASVASSSD